MYEFFVLSKLMDRPWHGYEIHQVLNAAMGPHRKVSWGTIYPLLRRLESAGLIRRVKRRSDEKDGRNRQTYTITAAGKARFVDLILDKNVDDPDFRIAFRLKVGSFSRIEGPARRALIDRHLKRLAAISEHTQAMMSAVKQAKGMSNEDRAYILLALSHDCFLAETEAEWIEQHVIPAI